MHSCGAELPASGAKAMPAVRVQRVAPVRHTVRQTARAPPRSPHPALTLCRIPETRCPAQRCICYRSETHMVAASCPPGLGTGGTLLACSLLTASVALCRPPKLSEKGPNYVRRYADDP